MKISRHIAFRADAHPELAFYVHTNGIAQVDPGDSITAFDITEDDPLWPVMARFLAAKAELIATAETIFTEQERRDAQWLTVRSKWRNGYPQPESGNAYRMVTYDTVDCCQECGGGLRQRDSFRFTSAPKWGKRHFMMLNWVFDELFADDIARSVLESSGLTGFHLLPVRDKRGQKELPGGHQLVIEEVSRPGLVSENVTSINAVKRCPVCGRTKYHPTGRGMKTFAQDVLQGMPPICRTQESFGWGHGADRVILIRQEMYRIIVENRLERGLVCEPICLV